MAQLVRLSLFLYTFAITVLAQYEQATLTGSVRDARGRALPDAQIHVQHSQTGLVRSTIFTTSGVYSLNGLPFGTYTFAASRNVFAEMRLTGISLAVGQTRTIDVMLDVEGRTDVVSVAGRTSEIL